MDLTRSVRKTSTLVEAKCFLSVDDENIRLNCGGGGATRPLPRDGGMEELLGDPAIGPRPKVWTRGQKWKKWC